MEDTLTRISAWMKSIIHASKIYFDNKENELLWEQEDFIGGSSLPQGICFLWVRSLNEKG